MPVSQEEVTEDGEPSVDFASSIEKVKDVSQTIFSWNNVCLYVLYWQSFFIP